MRAIGLIVALVLCGGCDNAEYAPGYSHGQGPRTWEFRIAGNPVIVFGESGLVQHAYDAPKIEGGMSPEQVRELLGDPSARDVLRNALVLHYSSPGESGRSEIRIIGIGRDGKVSAIYSYSTYE